MGTDYRRRLRERGVPDPPRGRPRLPTDGERLRSLWVYLVPDERAEFLDAAGLAQGVGKNVLDLGPVETYQRPLDDQLRPLSVVAAIWRRLPHGGRAEFMVWAGLETST